MDAVLRALWYHMWGVQVEDGDIVADQMYGYQGEVHMGKFLFSKAVVVIFPMLSWTPRERERDGEGGTFLKS